MDMDFFWDNENILNYTVVMAMQFNKQYISNG